MYTVKNFLCYFHILAQIYKLLVLRYDNYVYQLWTKVGSEKFGLELLTFGFERFSVLKDKLEQLLGTKYWYSDVKMQMNGANNS